MIRNSLRFSWFDFRGRTLKDLMAIIILFILSFYVVYFIPQIFSKLFFLFLLFLFLLSKKDYFWFAFFFILAQSPGYFFADFSGLSQYRLPLYTFLPGMSFTPLDLFVIVAILKAILKGKRTKLKLKKPLIFISFYIIFSFFITSFIFGTNVETLAWNLRWIFYYSIIISFSYLVTQKDEIYHFILLILPSIFFILFTQLYYVTTGIEFIDLFNPGYRGIALNTLTGELRPLVYWGILPFFSFVFALSLLENKDYKLSKVYLYFIIAISFLSIFLSATRQLFVMFLFTLASYILISRKKVKFSVCIVFILFIIGAIIVSSDLISTEFLMQSSWGRTKQIFDIIRSGISSVDTGYQRLIIELPIILRVIKQNPFIGYGFSDITMSYYDNDFGCVNTILMFGIFGFSLFVYFFIRYFAMIKYSIKRLSDNNPFKTTLKTIAIAWAALILCYLSVQDFFTFYPAKIFFVSILLAINEFFVRHANSLDSCNNGNFLINNIHS